MLLPWSGGGRTLPSRHRCHPKPTHTTTLQGKQVEAANSPAKSHHKKKASTATTAVPEIVPSHTRDARPRAAPWMRRNRDKTHSVVNIRAALLTAACAPRRSRPLPKEKQTGAGRFGCEAMASGTPSSAPTRELKQRQHRQGEPAVQATPQRARGAGLHGDGQQRRPCWRQGPQSPSNP